MAPNNQPQEPQSTLIKLLLTVATEFCEPAAEAVWEAGAESVSFTPPPHQRQATSEITAYFSLLADDDFLNALAQLDRELLVKLKISSYKRDLSHLVWNPELLDWRTFFPPLEVGDRWLVVPEWWQGASDRTILNVLPGTGFGTGRHESTRLCLRLLERQGVPDRFVDIGTGSGILAIAACHCGAAEGLAVDIDPVALENCRYNLRLNGLDSHISLILGRAACLATTFPLVIANLEEHIFLREAEDLARLVAAKGKFIVSGLVSKGWATIQPLFEGMGFSCRDVVTENEWVGALFFKR